MEWFLAILNAFGILSGFLGYKTVALTFFGISVVSLFYEYSKLTWPIFDRMISGFDVMEGVHAKMANAVVIFICLVMIYLVAAVYLELTCAVIAVAQSIFYLACKVFKEKIKKEVPVFITCFVELVFAFLLVYFKS